MSRIILFDDTGECGNRLVTYSFLLSFAREYEIPITNLCFWRYARYFDRHYSLIEYPWLDTFNPNSQILKDLNTYVGKTLEFTLEIPGINQFKPHLIFQGDILCYPHEILFRGLNALTSRCFKAYKGKLNDLYRFRIKEENNWSHYSTFLVSQELSSQCIFQQNLVENHAQYLRGSFKPQKSYQLVIDNFISNLKNKFSILVGVHIRRGDYSKYHRGKWYFSNQDFCRWMEMISYSFHDEKVGFILASNEELDLSCFPSLDVVKAPVHLIIDMYSLAACDFIIGPPSTFSGWASFIGDRPILFLDDADQEINPSSFEVWKPQFF